MSKFVKIKFITWSILIFILTFSYAKEKIDINILPMKPVLKFSSEINWFKERFGVTWNELVKEYTKDEIELFFKRWKSTYPTDPEAWINYANWKISQSRKETIYTETKLGSFELKVNNGIIEQHGIEGQGDSFISSNIYIDKQIFLNGIKLYQKALNRFPYRIDIYLYISKAYATVEEYNKQFEILEKMSKNIGKITKDIEYVNYEKISKENALFLIFKEAILNLHKTNSIEANNAQLDISLLMVKALPKNEIAWNYLVAIYSKLGNKKAAYKAVKKAYALNPKDDIIVYNLAVFSIELGFREEAIKHYKWILKNGKQKYMIEQAKRDLKLLLNKL